MTWWDVLLVVVIGFGTWRGYQRGFFTNLTSLIGRLLALVLAFFNSPALARWLDGQYGLIDQLATLLATRIQGEDVLAQATVETGEVAIALPLPQWLGHDILARLSADIANTSSKLYASVVQAIAHALAAPLWQLIVFLGLWLTLAAVLAFFGKVLLLVFYRFPLVNTIDHICGGLISLVLVALVVWLGSTILGFVLPDEQSVGLAISQSHLLPVLQRIFWPGH